MSGLRATFTMLALLVGTGCSTQPPVMEDFSGFSALDIIMHVRCEAGDAFRHAESGEHKEVMDVMGPAVVTMDFDFMLTENNIAKSNFSLIFGALGGKLTLGTNQGLDAKRVGKQTVQTLDTVTELVELAGAGDCNAAQRPAHHVLYPITGTVGLTRLIDEFLSLASSKPYKTSERGGGPPGSYQEKYAKVLGRFDDTLTFTTAVNLDANAGITVTGVNKDSLEAGLDFDNTRTDLHEVKVTLATPLAPAVDSERAIGEALRDESERDKSKRRLEEEANRKLDAVKDAQGRRVDDRELQRLFRELKDTIR